MSGALTRREGLGKGAVIMGGHKGVEKREMRIEEAQALSIRRSRLYRKPREPTLWLFWSDRLSSYIASDNFRLDEKPQGPLLHLLPFFYSICS